MLLRMILGCAVVAFCGAFPEHVRAATPQQTCVEVLTEFGLPTDGCAPPAPAAKPAKIAAKPAVSAAQLPANIKESHVFFPKGGATLDREAMVKLAQVIQILQTEPMANSCLKLVGHSDTSGSASINKDISMKRAESVAAFLRSSLQNPNRVQEVAAMGEEQPLPDWPSADRMNRRVAIWARHCP